MLFVSFYARKVVLQLKWSQIYFHPLKKKFEIRNVIKTYNKYFAFPMNTVCWVLF